jgi:CheY-like chemotaxis protein
MLNFFRAGPDLVRWNLQVVQEEPYQVRLTVHHSQGSIVEYFTSAEAALAHQQRLEELLISARGFGHPAIAEPVPSEAPKTGPPKGSLLIVDDDLAVTETFSRMLTLDGHTVRTANSAEAGLREAQAAHFDAIILDLRMPIVDGLGFLRRLRGIERHRSTPAVIVTGDYFLDDELSNEIASLSAEVRFKPMWLEDLVDLAQALLRSGRPAERVCAS